MGLPRSHERNHERLEHGRTWQGFTVGNDTDDTHEDIGQLTGAWGWEQGGTVPRLDSPRGTRLRLKRGRQFGYSHEVGVRAETKGILRLDCGTVAHGQPLERFESGVCQAELSNVTTDTFLMRRPLVIGASLAFFILLVVLAMRSQTLVIEYVPHAQAIWNEDELLVVVQKEEAEMEMSWLRRQLARVSGLFLPLPKTLPATVTLFRIRAEGSNRLDYPRFGLVGGAFPYEGQIYFLRGSDSAVYPLMHQLVNGDLVGVPRDRAQQIVSSFDLDSELLAREGWKEHTLYFTEGERTYPIQQGSKRFMLLLTQKHKAGFLKIEFIDEERNSEQLLYELSTGWRDVSE